MTTDRKEQVPQVESEHTFAADISKREPAEAICLLIRHRIFSNVGEETKVATVRAAWREQFILWGLSSDSYPNNEFS